MTPRAAELLRNLARAATALADQLDGEAAQEGQGRPANDTAPPRRRARRLPYEVTEPTSQADQERARREVEQRGYHVSTKAKVRPR